MPTARVANLLDDRAAVAYEHDDNMLGDMLSAEARLLRSDDLATLILRAQDNIAKANELLPKVTQSLAALKATRQDSMRRRKAREAATTIIEEVWLLEGYSEPQYTSQDTVPSA